MSFPNSSKAQGDKNLKDKHKEKKKNSNKKYISKKL